MFSEPFRLELAISEMSRAPDKLKGVFRPFVTEALEFCSYDEHGGVDQAGIAAHVDLINKLIKVVEQLNTYSAF